MFNLFTKHQNQILIKIIYVKCQKLNKELLNDRKQALLHKETKNNEQNNRVCALVCFFSNLTKNIKDYFFGYRTCPLFILVCCLPWNVLCHSETHMLKHCNGT